MSMSTFIIRGKIKPYVRMTQWVHNA